MDALEKFTNHYKKGFMPWVHQQPDFNLVEMVDNWPIKACKAVEIGCGTGTDSIFLAQRGFDIKGVDLVEQAIEMARENAKNAGVKVDFETADILSGDFSETFDFVFDRGVFHGNDSYESRSAMAEKIADLLNENGLWLSLAGSADGVKTEPGPPLRSATEIITASEPYFKLLGMRASYFGNDSDNPARIWVCLYRKR